MTELEPLLQARDSALRELSEAQDLRSHALHVWAGDKSESNLLAFKTADAVYVEAGRTYDAARKRLEQARARLDARLREEARLVWSEKEIS